MLLQCNIQTKTLSLIPSHSPNQEKKKKKYKVEQAHLKQNLLERADVAEQNP